MADDYSSLNTTKIDSFIPEIWANEALTALRSYLNLSKTVRRDFDSAVAVKGDKIRIPKTGALTVNDKNTNENVTRQDPADSEVTITLDNHKEVTFLVEDPARAEASQDVRGLYIKDAVIALAEEVEGDLNAEYENAGDDVSFDETSSSTVASSMRTLRKAFVDAKVPMMAQKFLYADSDTVNYLLSCDNFTKANEYGSSRPVMAGELGDIYGIKVFESQLVIETGSSSPIVTHNLAYTSDAMALVVRPLPVDGNGYGVKQAVVTDPESGLAIRVTGSYDANALGIQTTLDILYGIKTIREEFLFDVQLSV
jgi:hypothetical protein